MTFNLTDPLPVIPVKYVSFAGYGGSRSKVTFYCDNVTNMVDATTGISEIETVTENISTTTEQISNEIPNKTMLDSITDDEINEVVPKATDDDSIELTTVLTSALL